jgi:hypothetical protein
MAENILFTLVDEYGNSLEKFKLQGRFSFYYKYPNKEPKSVLEGQLGGGIAYGNLPLPQKDLESTTLIIEFESEFYNAPGKLLYKGIYQAPQKIAVSKKALDPEQRAEILNSSLQDLKQAASERVGEGEITQ